MNRLNEVNILLILPHLIAPVGHNNCLHSTLKFTLKIFLYYFPPSI